MKIKMRHKGWRGLLGGVVAILSDFQTIFLMPFGAGITNSKDFDNENAPQKDGPFCFSLAWKEAWQNVHGRCHKIPRFRIWTDPLIIQMGSQIRGGKVKMRHKSMARSAHRMLYANRYNHEYFQAICRWHRKFKGLR